MRLKFLCLIFLSKVIALGKDYHHESAVPLNPPKPTINTASPDLTKAYDFYDCFSIKGSKTCNGMDDIFLPETGVFAETASSFDNFVNKEVNNDSGILMALCPGKNVKHDLQKVAFRYSVYCGRYIYSQARWCPQNPDNVRANPQLSLCKRTCVEYAKSIADYGLTVCGNTDNTIGDKIKENIINKWCNIFTDDAGCNEGIPIEVEQCGYKSASYGLEAKTFNPHNKCWSTDSGDVMEKLKQNASKEKDNVKKIGSLKWKIAYPLGIMGTIFLLTMIFWFRQNSKYKRGYVPKSNNKNNDYEIIPSKAEPSRDYIDDDFISKFELEIPKASLNRSGSLSINKLNRIQSFKQRGIKYMVVLYNYHPQRNDELELRSGDRIRVEYEYEDGWAAGVNETSNRFGAFPLVCCTTNISHNEQALPTRSKSRNKDTSNFKRRPARPPIQNEPPLPRMSKPISQYRNTLY